MSVEDNVSEVSSESVDAPIQAESSVEELQDLVSAFDDDGDTNEYKSSGNNPESDDDWGNELSQIQEKIASEADNTPKEASEADSEQSDDASDEEPEAEAKPDDSEVKDEPEAEVSDKSGLIEVKTKDGVLELTLEQIQSEHPEVLQRLKNEVSGEKEIARRFSEFDQEKQAFMAEKTAIEGYVNEFAKATQDGNILGGLTYFAEFANIPPYLLKEQLIASLRPEIDKRSMMSQEEINNGRLKEENEYLVQKNESDQQKWQAEQTRAAQEKAEQDFQNQVNSIRETHNVTDEEWEAARAHLDETLPSDVETIPLSAMQERILEVRNVAATETRVSNLVDPVRDQVNEAFIAELKSLTQSHPELTDQDLQTVIKDSLRIKSEKELKKNLEQKSLEKPKKVIKNDSDRSFEDLTDLIDWD